MNINKIKHYDIYNTKYNPIYDDTRKHTKNILPITLDNNSKHKEIKKDNNIIHKCWGEKYENCNEYKNKNRECYLSSYNVVNPKNYYEISKDNKINSLKKINSNSIYDNTRIPIDNRLNMKIYNSPDIIENFDGKSNQYYNYIIILIILIVLFLLLKK
jgi:hypothetical protein